MRPGPLRFRIKLQAYTPTVDGFGQQVPGYTTVGTYWADIRFLSGRESVNALQKKSETTHKIVLRYIGEINISMRVLYTDTRTHIDRIFHILDINPVDERKRMYELKAVEVLQPTTGA